MLLMEGACCCCQLLLLLQQLWEVLGDIPLAHGHQVVLVHEAAQLTFRPQIIPPAQGKVQLHKGWRRTLLRQPIELMQRLGLLYFPLLMCCLLLLRMSLCRGCLFRLRLLR
jgi:hypothetical protein